MVGIFRTIISISKYQYNKRLSSGSEEVLDMPNKVFIAIVESLTDVERETWIEEFGECIAKLEILKQALLESCVPSLRN